MGDYIRLIEGKIDEIDECKQKGVVWGWNHLNEYSLCLVWMNKKEY